MRVGCGGIATQIRAGQSTIIIIGMTNRFTRVCVCAIYPFNYVAGLFCGVVWWADPLASMMGK